MAFGYASFIKLYPAHDKAGRMDGTRLPVLQKEVCRLRGNGAPPGVSTSPATEALNGDRDESAAFATVCCWITAAGCHPGLRRLMQRWRRPVPRWSGATLGGAACRAASIRRTT